MTYYSTTTFRISTFPDHENQGKPPKTCCIKQRYCELRSGDIGSDCGALVLLSRTDIDTRVIQYTIPCAQEETRKQWRIDAKNASISPQSSGDPTVVTLFDVLSPIGPLDTNSAHSPFFSRMSFELKRMQYGGTLPPPRSGPGPGRRRAFFKFSAARLQRVWERRVGVCHSVQFTGITSLWRLFTPSLLKTKGSCLRWFYLCFLGELRFAIGDQGPKTHRESAQLRSPVCVAQCAFIDLSLVDRPT